MTFARILCFLFNFNDLLSTHADRQGVGISFTVFLCVILFVCLFVRLQISPARIKLPASNFARRFIGVQSRESPILVNFVPHKPKIGQILVARAPADSFDRDATFVEYRAACGRIGSGICEYTAVPEDGRSLLNCYTFLCYLQTIDLSFYVYFGFCKCDPPAERRQDKSDLVRVAFKPDQSFRRRSLADRQFNPHPFNRPVGLLFVASVFCWTTNCS